MQQLMSDRVFVFRSMLQMTRLAAILTAMRAKLLLLLAILLAFTLTVTAAPSRVLFVGNSYTYVNKLPKIIENIIASTTNSVPTINSSTPPGETFEGHLMKQPGTLKLIDEGNWDVVVLQGNSLQAAMAEQFEGTRTSFLKGASGLYERIKAKSPYARVLLFETWARHADYWKDSKAEKGIGNNPTEMQARVRKWCNQVAADKKDCLVAPVGDAWELNYKNPNAVRLHAKDNSHPAFNGSYLAALVIYATIYHPPNLVVTDHGNLTSAEAAYLQRLAAQVTSPATR